MYKILFKRSIDILVALFGLIVLSPVLIIVGVSLYIANNGKVFFFQSRPGLNEKIFKIVKFKTMNDKMDADGNLLADNERITAVGSFVRKTSLDEIPQLVNVLIGDMSLIGPRPLLPQYLPLYDENERRRHEVKPGITGWAQINGRNAISWKKKFQLDLYYVNHCSFGLDMKIVYLTFAKVLNSSGVNASEGVTMEAFNGKN